VIEIKGKFVLVLAVLLIAMCHMVVSAQPVIEWHTQEEGIQIAESQNKLEMIFFESDSCPACKKQKEVFTDAQVINMSKNFVPIAGSQQLAGQYGIRYIPTIVFTNSHGEEFSRLVGYRDSGTLVKEMQQTLKLFNPSQKQEQPQTPGYGVIATITGIFVCWLWLKRGYKK
jgi:thioredoxin-related protein